MNLENKLFPNGSDKKSIHYQKTSEQIENLLSIHISKEYDTTQNVITAKQQLQDNFNIFQNYSELKSLIKEILYEMLIKKPDFLEKLKKYNGDILKLGQNYQSQNDLYNASIFNVTRNVKSIERETNPGWMGVDCKNAVKRKKQDCKFYISIDENHFHFLTYFQELYDELEYFCIKHEENINIKFPISFITFLAYNDTFIISFHDIKHIAKLKRIIDFWCARHSIQKTKREFKRTDIGKDMNGLTHTQNVVQKSIEHMESFFGKYDTEIFIDELIKYTIYEAQKEIKD